MSLERQVRAKVRLKFQYLLGTYCEFTVNFKSENYKFRRFAFIYTWFFSWILSGLRPVQ